MNPFKVTITRPLSHAIAFTYIKQKRNFLPFPSFFSSNNKNDRSNCQVEQGHNSYKNTKLVLAGVVSIPPIAIGAWQWGDKTYWNWTPEAEKDAKEAFDKAVELGIPFYDTAEVYGDGESEREIKRFREAYSEEERKKQIIATKYFPHDYRTQFPDVLLSALKDSLARLGTLDVDLYQIHAAIHPASIETVANALADAFDAKLVKAVGVSNYSIDEIKVMHAALKKRGIPLASNQVSFSLVRTIPEKSGLVQLCHDLGIAILAYSRKAYFFFILNSRINF
ncbi:unnamed protein product [Mucor hiemalis]